ncbi:cell wall associated protein [Streptococcus infantarius subsp. infantarius]|nr:cell wall associated protein [Streptococcus infantarius subsp. infantarius]MCO4610537.1 cell wall associated protein [Streptococcus infantarius subsp. infantarius]MCO4623846.1 cell wall associated protein [Streptococcus infantarius subsp. infantarius]
MIASVLFMGGEVVVAEDMVSADAMLQEQVTQSSDNQVVTNENTKQETSEGELVSKINQPSEVPDIGDKEENVNAEQDLALKDDQVSTERRKSARTRDSC